MDLPAWRRQGSGAAFYLNYTVQGQARPTGSAAYGGATIDQRERTRRGLVVAGAGAARGATRRRARRAQRSAQGGGASVAGGRPGEQGTGRGAAGSSGTE